MLPLRYSVANINHLTKTHLQLIIEPIAKPLLYEAGQYLKILYPNNELMPFSMANSPAKNHQIELHIRVANDDLLTQRFVQSLNLTRSLTIVGPFGDCQYKNNRQPLLLLAAGTGFAPAKAIIEKLISSNPNQECHLYWTVKYTEDFYLAELPKTWQASLKNFHYVPISTQAMNNENKNNILDLIKADFVNLSSYQVYVFGPPDLAIDTFKLLVKKGLRKENFFTDVLSRDQILALS